VRSRRPELRTVLEDDGWAVAIREPNMEGARRPREWLHGADRQEIDVVGVSVPVVFALDHPVGVELPAAKMGTVADLKLSPRWSGEVAMRIAPLDTGLGDSDELRAYGGTHYVAYSRDSLSMARARRWGVR
jgi:hypothetical protein